MVLLASTLPSRFFFTEFWFLPVFVIVFTVTRLIVMSCSLSMRNKHPFSPIGLYLSVDIELR